MTGQPAAPTAEAAEAAVAAFARRVGPGQALAEDAERVARACYDMALRFHRGGTLLVFGNGSGASDSHHVAVEFIHPVVVGKRALPALALTNDVATLTALAASRGFDEVYAAQVELLGRPADIALGVSADGGDRSVLRGLEAAHERGLLTVALVGGAGGGDGGAIAASPAVDHALVARSDDPQVVKEVHVTTYHVLWELVHVFFEQPGVLGPELVR